MLPYQNSCFISYRHPPLHDGPSVVRHFWMEFITEFQTRLDAYMTIGLSAYRDDKLRSKPGTKYPAELSRQLCHSACMIAILVPEYLESSWCLAEWRAMERLELSRNATASNDGFIIPVLFRGDYSKFADLCGIRQYSDFRHVAKPRSQLDNIRYRRQIEEIASRIAELANSKPDADCSKFVIDSNEEVVVPRFDDPDPLA
jgi:TIR domain